jgi:hypothetical protein
MNMAAHAGRQDVNLPHESARAVVSWLQAYRDGVALTAQHRVFLPIAGFAVLCERSMSVYTAITGTTLGELAKQYGGFLDAFWKDPFGGLALLAPYPGLVMFMPVYAALLALGGFIYIGVLGLLRDLLVREGFNVRDLGARGKALFWPVIKFKLPIYFALSALFLALAPVVLAARSLAPAAIIAAAAALGVFGVLAFLGRVALSLGPKFIAVEGDAPWRVLASAVAGAVRPALWEVVWFYAVMFVLGGAALAAPVAMSWLGVPPMAVIALTVFLLSFYAIFLRASSFYLYFQLAGARTSPEARGGAPTWTTS